MEILCASVTAPPKNVTKLAVHGIDGPPKEILTVPERLGWRVLEQNFMIEIFSGTAPLTSVAKQHGMRNSMALDKIKKKGSKAKIYVF